MGNAWSRWVAAIAPALAVASCLALGGAARAASFLDQEFDPIANGPDNVGQAFGVGNDVAQTFTVGRTGQLTSVEVLIGVPGGTTDALVLDVRSTSAEVPAEANTTPPVLASVTRAAAAIPNVDAFVSFDLSAANLFVTAGDVLAIVLRSGSGGLGLIPYHRSGGSPDPYAAGAAYFRDSNDTTVWLEMTDMDFGFRTFVEPDLCFGSEATIVGAGEIEGTPDEDVIVGSVGDDDIDGGGGPDAICGLEGDDDISSRANGIAVDGGPGDDRIKLSGGGGATILGGDGDDTISSKQASGDNEVSGGADDDVIKVSTKAGSNAVDAGDGADEVSVKTTGGTTTVDGGAGDDEIKASTKGGGATTVDGGPGSDTCKVKGAVPTCEFAN